MAKLTFITIDFDETTLEEYEILYEKINRSFGEYDRDIVDQTLDVIKRFIGKTN